MEKIIAILDEHGKLNTTNILKMTGLSPKSVCNTLKFFLEKDIVTLHTFQDRKNNEKIYSLKRTNAILYIHHFHWNTFAKTIQDVKKQSEKINMIIRGRKFAYYTDEFPELVTKEIENKKIHLSTKYLNKFSILENPVSLIHLPMDIFEEIVNGFHTGRFCRMCWENDILTELQIHDLVHHCDIHGIHEIAQHHDKSRSELNFWADKKHKHNVDKQLLKKFNSRSL